jgi:hypothetical protein
MTPEELEQIVHQRLRELPAPRAPRSLAPAVMAAVRARASRPWYARPWRTWPAGGRVFAAVSLAAVAAVVVALLPGVAPVVVAALTALVGPMAEAVRVVQTVANAGHTVASVFASSLGAVLIVPVVLMLSMVAVVGVTLRRVALGGAY